ncbi:GNAT family N-acetyltransferase [Dactylosporangium sp. NBC_01737]|uniref:GNAT family N-acetyltransferase n=1 Tax=Dactylosporangium sp. NBC_01737 TaxID=2975959 RepID=UPI002E160C22|nr:GNAT family N-acetyltransferase [Dactylosporangium sp. NBC_01737]
MVDWVKLELDVEGFDDAGFERYLRRAQSSGTRFTTMADLGDAPEHRRVLYELNRTCSADIPDRGPFYTYDEYAAQRLDVATYNPGGVIIAVQGDEWIGMSATSLHPDRGHAFSDMTGVLAPHRGKGLSLALKLLAIRFVRSSGYRRLVAFHHPQNHAAIAMNRRLGFVDQAR